MAASTAATCVYSDSSSDDENYGDTNHRFLSEDDEDEIVTCAPSQCLFCESFFNTGDLVLKHVEKDHQVPLNGLFADTTFDFYSFVKLVNYIRKHQPVESELLSKESLNKLLTSLDDSYMIPTVEDDGLLQFDFDSYQENLHRLTPDDSGDKTVILSAQEHNALVAQAAQLSQVKEELQQLKGSYSDMVAGLRSSAQRFISSAPTQQDQSSHAKGESNDRSQVHKLTDSEDDGYISSYSHYSIHLEMLQDVVRTGSYKEAICSNPSLFKDKVVLDVGCGTGILSMFAAKAGASKVIAVDMSDIAYQAIDIIRENGLEDKVTVVKGRVEEISLPVDQVDIIISEWMGYFLLFESMLDSVLFARDRWLNTSGTVWPNVCTMHLTASSDPALFTKNIAFWEDVYGCKMTCMKGEVCRDALVQTVNMEYITSEPALIKTVDCCSCAISDLDFTSDFSLCLEKDCTIYALIGYFDTLFHSPAATNKVSFSTGPLSKSTHWKQTVFLLPQPLHRLKGQSIAGSIDVRKMPKDPRSLQVEITIDGKKQKYIIA